MFSTRTPFWCVFHSIQFNGWIDNASTICIQSEFSMFRTRTPLFSPTPRAQYLSLHSGLLLPLELPQANLSSPLHLLLPQTVILMIRSTWLLIASFLFSFSRLSQPCWVAVQHLTLTTSNWEGERSDLKLILLAIVKQCCSSRCVYCPRATMRCSDAKMCRLIAGGTMVTSKEGVVHPKF